MTKQRRLVICAIHLTAWLPFSAYVVCAPLLERALAFGPATSGIVFSSYLAGYAVGSIVVLPKTDRTPPETIMLIGLIALALAHMAFPWIARGPVSASLLRFLTGVAQVSVFAPGIRIVAARSGRGASGTAVGYFVAAAYAGSTTSYVLGGWLLDWTGSWQATYAWMAAAALVGAAAAVPLLRGYRSAGGSPSHPGLRLGLLREPRLRAAIVAYALHTAELYLARLWLPGAIGAAMIYAGYGPLASVSSAAVAAGAGFMLGVPLVALGGQFSDRAGRHRVAGAVFLATFVLSLALSAGRFFPLPLFLVIAAAFGALTGADSAIYSAAVVELAPKGEIGSAQALQSFLGLAAGAAAPIAAGMLVGGRGGLASWTGPFLLSAALAASGFVVTRRMHSRPSG